MNKVLLWGTGKIADEFLVKCETLDCYSIIGIIDNNIEKQGEVYHGYEVISPKEITRVDPDYIVILTDAYDEIAQQITTEYPIYADRVENKYFFYKQSLKKRYKNTDDNEIKEVLRFVDINGLDIFNYPFVKKYKCDNYDCIYDEQYGLFYVIHCGKRLYFSRKYDSPKVVSDYYRSILMEQDEQSPHRYFAEKFKVDDGDIVVDAGKAEGNFALEVIDKVSKIYLIETDEKWIEALNITFKNYKDKVIILNAFVSSYDEGKFVRLDSLITEPINFIKMDIEGNEWDGLLGAEHIIEKSEGIKLAIYSYHSDFDQILIEHFMDTHNIRHTTTSGYLWYPWRIRQNYISTRFNRAIVRGTKIAGEYPEDAD